MIDINTLQIKYAEEIFLVDSNISSVGNKMRKFIFYFFLGVKITIKKLLLIQICFTKKLLSFSPVA